VRESGSRPAAAGIALAGLVLAVAGCSQVLPLGPAPAATPAPRHLASAIVMQPGLSQSGASPSGCPAGSIALSGPGIPIITAVGNSTGTPDDLCFRLLGKAVTFTSAGVTMSQRLATSREPALYALRITLPPAEAAALTSITTKVAGTQDQLAIIVAGKTWGMPITLRPLTNGQFTILEQSRDQALQLQRILLKPA